MRIHFLPYPFLAGLIALAVVLAFQSKRHSRTYLFFSGIFGIYLLMVAAVTLFPIPLPRPGAQRSSVAHILAQINLIPLDFHRLFRYSRIWIFLEIFGNILMTIPYGFGLPFLTQIRPKKFIWAAMAIGFTIETTQLLLALIIGASYRQTDINDFLLNTLGALIGYGLFQGFAWLYLAVYKDTELKKKGAFAYLLKVADRQEWVNEHLT